MRGPWFLLRMGEKGAATSKIGESIMSDESLFLSPLLSPCRVINILFCSIRPNFGMYGRDFLMIIFVYDFQNNDLFAFKINENVLKMINS